LKRNCWAVPGGQYGPRDVFNRPAVYALNDMHPCTRSPCAHGVYFHQTAVSPRSDCASLCADRPPPGPHDRRAYLCLLLVCFLYSQCPSLSLLFTTAPQAVASHLSAAGRATPSQRPHLHLCTTVAVLKGPMSPSTAPLGPLLLPQGGLTVAWHLGPWSHPAIATMRLPPVPHRSPA
jgi:hypothetical protein